MEQLADLADYLNAHHIRLVYTPSPQAGWPSWQVIATWRDGAERVFPIRSTSDEAIAAAVMAAHAPPTRQGEA